MRDTAKQISRAPRAALTKAALATAVPCLALLALAPVASADYEQVPEHFGESGEAAQLERSRAMAINVDGVGGVEAGSLYVVGINGRVLRFSPGKEGEAPQFREAWGWNVGKEEAEEFQRCGPTYASEPRPPHTFATCLPVKGNVVGGEQIGHFNTPSGVSVDQATGDVYVLNIPSVGHREHHLIEVFTATGTPIENESGEDGFGDRGRSTPFPSESIAEGPEKLHEQANSEGDGISVDEDGTVLVIDSDFSGAEGAHESRVMSFEPEHAGDYAHYVYAGQEKDITVPNLTKFLRIALVGSNRIVTSGTGHLIREYPTGGGSTPICSYEVSGGSATGLAANPLTGEVFYIVRGGSQSKLVRLGPCHEATGEFKELQEQVTPSPVTQKVFALALNPSLAWGPLRSEGVLYGADAEDPTNPKGIGDVFAPAKVEALPPAIESESVSATSSSSATLRARIDPRNQATDYAFQYLTEAQYEANEPNEGQSLTVSATGGLFGLSFEGQSAGGTATANLNSGSATVSGLIVAKGTANLHAAGGTATLHGAVGSGTIIEGSQTVSGASASEGAFEVGQTISIQVQNGAVSEPAVPAGTTITAVSGSSLTLSAAATKTKADAAINAGTAELTSVSVSEGTFEAGMTIEAPGIPSNTTITTVSGTTLTLSKPVTKPGTGVELKAGSMTLEGLSTSEGTFEAGQPIAGEGIAAGTTVTAVESGKLRISKIPTEPGTGVAISSSGPAPLAVGEAIEGPGIEPGTRILAAEAGQLTLSQPATATASGAHLRAGLPFDASAAEVQKALEGLSTIGEGSVEVSGGQGDESGSSPYEVEFSGALTSLDLPELAADATGLSGGPASATVATLHDGGEGFAHGATEAPVGWAALEAGGLASVGVSGLAPQTAYRFRVVAKSQCNGPEEPSCEALGEPASFTTYPLAAAGLPDNRTYELVSPAQKQGGEVFPADSNIASCLGECKPPGADVFSVFPMQSSPDGNSVSYMGFPFSPEEGAASFNSYISRRTASGWQTIAMSPRLLGNASGLAYDQSLDQGLIHPEGGPTLSEEAPARYENLYLQDAADPSALKPVLTEALFAAHPPHHEVGTLTLRYAGHSGDFAVQYFAANDSLTGATAYAPEPPEINQAEFDLYESREGRLSLVNVLPDFNVAEGASFASASPDSHGASESDARVFWEAGGKLYVREEGKRTLEVEDPGHFLSATPDGSRVLLSDGCVYDLAEEACVADLTEGHDGFLGIAGQSSDLSRIYFVDTAKLAGENERHEEAEPGKPNLYLYEAGNGASFIATLLVSDGAGGSLNLNDWAAEPGERTAEASPDGHYLAFASSAPLTGYGNRGPCGRNADGTAFVSASCEEAFLYDSTTGKLTCPSCNPSGEAPLGNSTLRRIRGADVRPWLPQPRYLTDQGRLFFDSGDRLSVRDTNGRVEDVYESEPQGVGSCGRAQGCVTLISPGSGEVDSNFLAMGGEGEGEGSNVFFTTREELVPKDTDELIDVYDARVGGGFSSETETTRPECQGEACQPAPNPPAETTPASAAFHGAGNLEEGGGSQARCPKAKRKVKSRGKTRCVAKHTKRHRHHKRHHRKHRRASADRRAHR